MTCLVFGLFLQYVMEHIKIIKGYEKYMLAAFGRKIFGSHNDRIIKSYSKAVFRINALEQQMQKLSDAELRGQTHEIEARIGGRSHERRHGAVAVLRADVRPERVAPAVREVLGLLEVLHALLQLHERHSVELTAVCGLLRRQSRSCCSC